MKQSLPADSERQQTKQIQPGADAVHSENALSSVDNRLETLAKRKLRETINSSPKMLAQRKLAEAMNNSPRVTQRKLHAFMNRPVKQLQAAPEEELLQGKFEVAQHLEEEEPLQGKFKAVQRVEEEEPLASQSQMQQEQQLTAKPNDTGLPDNLKNGIEVLSGMSMDSVRVHYNSSQPAQLNALAYTQGTDIHVAPEQEQHLPHETWHVLQQAQGRVKPTMQMKDGGLNSRPNPSTSLTYNQAIQLVKGDVEIAMEYYKFLQEMPEFQQLKDWQKKIAGRNQYHEGLKQELYSHSTAHLLGKKHIREVMLQDVVNPRVGLQVGGTPQFGTVPQMDPHMLKQQENEEVIRQAAQELQLVINGVNDTLELEEYFVYLQGKYGLTSIGFEDLGTENARVKIKINPEFEIKVSGTNVEMRAEGTGKGSGGKKFKTNVGWETNTIVLDGNGPYQVGSRMHAFPLSQDHQSGSESKADTEHKKWMNLLPSSTSHPGNKDEQYIRGHLLNDNLGGPAIENNLFPITGYANGQHEYNAERFIKGGIENGYVYEYLVWIDNVNETTTSQLGTTYYVVNANINFKFARLDAALKPLSNATHEGKIKSKFGKRKDDPYDKKKEFQKEHKDFSSHPKAIPLGGEAMNTVTSEAQSWTTNSKLDIEKLPAFTLSAPSTGNFGMFGLGGMTGGGQQINPTPNPAYNIKLSLWYTNPTKKIEDRFFDLVPKWSLADIQAWIKNVRARNLKKWADVESEAVSQKLDAAVAKTLFAATGGGRNKTTISGQA